MVYLDLDDTLIPTTIRNSIRLNYGFELFKIVDTTSLQSDIITSIDKIKEILNKYYPNDSIYFCLVSNATQDWINDMLSNKDCYFPILGTFCCISMYFHNICISISKQDFVVISTTSTIFVAFKR